MQSWQRHSEARAAARAEAVVARSVPARLDIGDCDSAPGLLGGRFRASTITCCMGTGRTEGRCDLDHTVVAWPGVALISSLPAHALLPIVHLISLVERRPRACSFENAEVELVNNERELRDRIAWRSGRLAGGATLTAQIRGMKILPAGVSARLA